MVLDNFNRVESGPSWGAASASGYAWTTYDCPDYSASVDGQAGILTGSLGVPDCPVFGFGDQLMATGPIPRVWEAPSWSFTGKFKTTAVDNGQLRLGVFTRVNQLPIMAAQMRFYPGAGEVWGLTASDDQTASFAWTANTWYEFKLAAIYGDQMRVRVWPAGDPEPTDWLLAVNAANAFPEATHSPLGALWASSNPTSVYVDDFSFGPAPFLPKLPPPPGTEHNPPFDNQEAEGDPVSTYTGAFSDTKVDFAIPGRGPAISFSRSYNSNDTRVTTLGPGWTHSYNIRLVSPGDETDDIVLIGPQGRSDRYTESGGTYTAPTGIDRTLVRNGDGTYTAEDKARTAWMFDASGALVQIRDRYGNASNMTYDGLGRLSKISDPAGRGQLTLTYNANGQLGQLSDWSNPMRKVIYNYDASGRLWKANDRNVMLTTYTYDGSSHRIATITNARSKVVLTNTYDAQGRVATQKDARGLQTGDVTTFDYVVNPDGTRVTTMTTPSTSFESSFEPTLVDSYDANGWLVERVTRPSSTETLTHSFGYDADGNRIWATDANGNRSDYCYDVEYDGSPVAAARANLTRAIAPAPGPGADRPVVLTRYDAKDNPIEVVTPRGVPSGETVSCTTDLSAIDDAYAEAFAYDPSMVHLLARTVRFTDPDLGLRTATTKYEYGDAQNPGRVTRTIPPRGNTAGSPDYTYATSYTYASSGSEAGLLKEIVDPLGSKVTYGYDPVGRLTTVVDPLGNAAGGVPAEHTTSFSYDGEDRLRFETQPAPVPGGSPLVTETRYDQVGNPTVRIDARGQVTTYAYDDRNSLFQVKQSPSPWTSPLSPPGDAITTEYAYDAGGSATRVTRAKGNGTYERVTDYEFDGRGLQRRETQYPSWPSTSGALVATRSYDPAGNLATLTDPLGQGTTFGYDALNRVTSVDYADPGTADVTYGYDADGNRTSMADGTGTTSYTYDEIGRLQSVTSPGPTSVGYRYDLDGNRSKLIYPDSTAVTYTFDKAARLSSLADWASRSVSYTYWPDGLVKTATNPDASVATYSYDNVRRLVDIVHMHAGTKIEGANYGFDAVGNVTSMANGSLANQFARPDGLVSSSGTWTGTYASINEPTPNDGTFLASPASPTTAHFYEVTLGDVTPPFVTSGTTFRYRYAKSGNNSGKTTNLVVELRQGSTVIAAQTHNNIPGVDGSGWQPGTLTLNAAQAAMVTDVADLRLRFRPSSSGGGQGRQALVSWAEVQLPGSGDPSTLASHGYDRLSRLVSVAGPDGPRSYTYDPVGNRLTKVAGTTTAYTYDRADRMLTAGGTSVSVDGNGNLIVRGTDLFDFDQANRLVSATVGGADETYVYDGDGTRFSRQAGTDPAIRYVSDVAGGLPTTIADGNRKYVYGVGLAYAVSGSDVEIYHSDGLGSIRAITDAAAVITSTQRADEWGLPVASTGSSSQPFGFTGEPRDATGLTYLRARYYDPELGRFLSRDTWPGSQALPITLNRYTYANNNPTTLTDPSGHFVDAIVDLLSLAYDAWSLATGPEKDRAINLAALGADAASLAIPGFTGGGWFVRGANHADEVADGLRWADEAATAACSFTPETLVAGPDGPVEISTIDVGDIVLAWDEATGDVVERPVTAVLPHPDDEIAKVTIDGVVITTTPDHPFYTLDRGWVDAGDLWAGARVRTISGASTVTSVATDAFQGVLWDLTVQGVHTFFVGAPMSLVHNCAMPLGKGSTGRSAPANLNEQLLKEQVYANPGSGQVIQNIQMSDPRWLATDGWVKMKTTSASGVEAHWVYNTISGAFDDFKFK